MRGIATIDHQDGSPQTVVWVTNRTADGNVLNVNSVAIDRDDASWAEKISSLTHSCAVLATPGSDLHNVPVHGRALSVESLDALLDAADQRQTLIRDAVSAFAVRPDAKTGKPPKNPRKLVSPTFPSRPSWAPGPSDDAVHRALRAANFVGQCWSYWLATERERLVRVTSGSGEAPRMMPDSLASPELELLPKEFTQLIQAQAEKETPMDFTAIDFETANAYRGSPCSVGLVRVRDGQIVEEQHFLIRPPARVGHFDPFNIRIHGITPEMVQTAPEWADAYPKIMDFIGDDLVVAHNAAFDTGVLRDACAIDELEAPSFDFLCTLVLSRRALDLPSYRLPFVTDALGVTLEGHHDALEDARAVVTIVTRLSESAGVSTLRDLAELHKVRLGRVQPGQYLGSKGKSTGGLSNLEAPTVNLDADPDGYLFGRTIVFTGALQSMTRAEAWVAAAEVGATPEKTTTKRTNVLVIGDVNDFSLRPGAVLTKKAEKAFELQAKGQPIEVMTEDDFIQCIDAAPISFGGAS